jgi:hypothetical protein
VGDCGYGDARGAGRKGGVNVDSSWERALQELSGAEEAQPDGTLAAALKERSEGEEATADGRDEAEGGASSSHIAMLGSAGRRFLALHIWHSSLRSPP